MKKCFLLSVCIIWAISLFAQEAQTQDSITKYIANKSIAFTSEYTVIGNGITFDKIFPLSPKEKISFSQSLLTSIVMPATQSGTTVIYGSTSFTYLYGLKRHFEGGMYLSYGSFYAQKNNYLFPFGDLGIFLGYRYQNPLGGYYLKSGVKFGAISALVLLISSGSDNSDAKSNTILNTLMSFPIVSIGYTFKRKNIEITEMHQKAISKQIDEEENKFSTKRENFYNKKIVFTPYILIQNRDLFGQYAPKKVYSEIENTSPFYQKDEAQSLHNIKNTTAYIGIGLTYKQKFNLGISIGINTLNEKTSGGYRLYKNFRKERALNTNISILPFAFINHFNSYKKRIIEPELGLGYTYSEISILNFRGGYDNGGRWPFAYGADYLSFQNIIQLQPSINLKPHYKLHINISVPINLFAFTSGNVYRSHVIKTKIPNAIPEDQYTYPKTEWNEDLTKFYSPKDLSKNDLLFHSLNLKIGYAF